MQNHHKLCLCVSPSFKKITWDIYVYVSQKRFLKKQSTILYTHLENVHSFTKPIRLAHNKLIFMADLMAQLSTLACQTHVALGCFQFPRAQNQLSILSAR